MIRIAHLINGLHTGGAEIMLYRLVKTLDPAEFQTEVISMIGPGPVGDSIATLGIPVRSLGMRRGIPSPVGLLRASSYLRDFRPHLLHCWMYHSNLLGSLTSYAAGLRMPVIWALHHTSLDNDKWLTRLTARAAGLLSRRAPARIVSCSEETLRYHVTLGYDHTKTLVIENGFDLTAYRPDSKAVQSIAGELGLPANTIFVASIARFHPQKDHRNLITAAAEVVRENPHVHVLLCGDGMAPSNELLASWIAATGLHSNFHLLGRRSDVPRIMAASVLVTSSSSGEAFPNVIGEAMACACPCVVTDVGDSARLVGDTGFVVPPRDPQALAAAIRRVLLLPLDERLRLGRSARVRVSENFAIERIVARYRALYLSLLPPNQRSSSVVARAAVL